MRTVSADISTALLLRGASVSPARGTGLGAISGGAAQTLIAARISRVSIRSPSDQLPFDPYGRPAVPEFGRVIPFSARGFLLFSAAMTIHISPQARRASEILISIKAIGCSLEKPFKLTSGWASPVYVDCRKVITFVQERREIIKLMAETVSGEQFDVVAGGETAGISYGAWMAEALSLPYIYIRKKPKEVGKTQQIEGELGAGQKVLLVEDLATDGASKVNFLNAIRTGGGICDHSVVVFYYGIFPKAPQIIKDARITLHALTTWRHMIDAAEALQYFPPGQIKGIREFLENPEAWSKAHGGL
jgi:orotate phosphoribosyltransferase